MPSITDQAADEILRKPRDTIRTLREITTMINGICIRFSKAHGKRADPKDVMNATKRSYERALRKMRSPKGTEITIRKLKASAEASKSKVEKISEPVSDDLLRYFKKHCRTYGVQYSILRQETEGKSDQYYVFFKADDALSIKQCIEMGMRDYTEDLKHPENKKKRDSVLLKLARNREIVKIRDREKEKKERHHHKSSRSK